ncbi:class II aldolase/adducin family protein [Sphingomonas immobilis]|uniref:Class II aldolase/adducin family protein n=1 Tax=Sphingomonas immobilis TaxID=3063997 RepID=A0ABT8ZYL7_9SPHN|nr:class II aldolase/adducin family protein [Sphingomonas sp. CA1-15]MDO7842297.1 class II aldolase/adducin family protein [Sphingomonas sp. CA1-15]
MATLAFDAAPVSASPISEGEAAARRDLAACYRLCALNGWDDLVATHISARVPGEEAFLINPFGFLFEEITPSSLVKIDLDGNLLAPTPHSVNQAGFVIHSAVHAARPDAHCVMHLHTRDGVAVSAIEEGLLPLNQTAMLLATDIAFHEYEGVALHLEERERLAADLGSRSLMLLRNHGTLALGPTVADAFTSMYFLEWACSVQVRTLAMGRPLHMADAGVVAGVAAHRSPDGSGLARDLVWPAMLRRLDRHDPHWRD